MSAQASNVGFVTLRLEGAQTEAAFHELDTAARAQDDGVLPAAIWDLKPWHRRTLRVALAMKGGLSLAVWIGGAIAELDILRRIRIYDDDGEPRALVLHMTDDAERRSGGPDKHLIRRAEHYARLLMSRGYDRVEFDVLAGASAGGLNGVLYGVAQRAGVGFDTILSTWLTTGSAWGLLQTGKPHRFDSVARGDDYFWPEVSTAITRIIEQRSPGSPLRADQVVVDLSATLLDAVDSSDRTTAEGRAQFRFVGGRDELDDRAIPPRGTDELSARDFADIARIAYAARSTSSFPFVFEPALIYSGSHALATAHGWDAPRDPCLALDAPDMRMVFNAHRSDAATQPFRVADGGILDNIPIDRALNAVRNMPADEHSNRAILYLDPSPKETAGLFRRPTVYEEGRPTLLRDATAATELGPSSTKPVFSTDPSTIRNDVGSRLMSTVTASLRKRSARESRDDEIEEVDLVRATTSVAKARNEVLAVRLDGRAMDDQREAEVARAYARYRAASDFELLAPAMLHPGEWILGTDLGKRPELVALDRLGIVHVETAFRRHAIHLDPTDVQPHTVPTARGRQALVDATLAALSWTRAIEQTAFQAGRLVDLDRQLDDSLRPPRHDRSDPESDQITMGPLPEGAPRSLARRKLSRVMRDAARDRDAAILSTLRKAQAVLQRQQFTTGTSLSLAGARRVVERWAAADTVDDTDLADRWAHLDDIVRWLLDVSSRIDELAHERWSRTPWSRLMQPDGVALPARQLPLLFGGSGIPQPISSVRFHRIGSDVQPAQPLEYRKLMEDQLLRGYRAALAHTADELDAVTVGNCLDEQSLRSTAKLAGLRAANLAGFLSAHWRRNDWWWGRLDAASGVIEFLSSLPSVADERPAVSKQDAVEPASAEIDEIDPDAAEAQLLGLVHDELLRQLVTDRDLLTIPPTMSEDEPRDIRATFVRGAQGLDALADSYRMAIASRTLRAASTALTQGLPASSPKRFLHWLVRPVAVLLPSLISVPRLILLYALLVCAALTVWPMIEWTPESQSAGDSTVVASLAGVIAVAALMMIRVVAAASARRRRDRRILAHTSTRRWTRSVIATAQRRARAARAGLVGATAALAGGLVVIEVLYGMDNVLFWALLIAFIATGEATAHAMQTVPATLARTSSPTPLAGIAGIAAILVTIAVTGHLAPLPHEPAGWASWSGWSAVGWHALGAALVGGAIAATMLAGVFRRRWRILVPVTVTAAAAGLASILVAAALVPFPPVVNQVADVIVVGWCAGTALWWAPWWRGWATGTKDGPEDRVHDLDWADTRVPTVGRRRRRTARADRRAERAGEPPTERTPQAPADASPAIVTSPSEPTIDAHDEVGADDDVITPVR
ncbi:DUF3376 domain-containing protein [Agromyces sp. Soil535]|uniref:DUF3376 domain-containing protein n=1 Tax=Agromyces sp. Soil535 TaxID=1736390 RepID=UPI000AD0CE06|nr:DUF3376 domain-containing protein [Agromyces sp. Soil535]